jgi:hypothetical protein
VKKTISIAIVLKEKLSIKGICMNYTIQVIEGYIDTTKIKSIWQDPQTGIIYNNVFALGSVCDFPSGLNEGDEFILKLMKP